MDEPFTTVVIALTRWNNLCFLLDENENWKQLAALLNIPIEEIEHFLRNDEEENFSKDSAFDISTYSYSSYLLHRLENDLNVTTSKLLHILSQINLTEAVSFIQSCIDEYNYPETLGLNELELYEQGLALYRKCYFEKSIPYLRKSADIGYNPAYLFLHRACSDVGAVYVNSKEHNRILQKCISYKDWFMEQALTDDPVSQYHMGVYCSTLENDNASALEWFKKSADQQYVPAFYEMGVLYGLQDDECFSLTWNTNAAERGFLDAQYKLGRQLLDAKDREDSANKAAFWLEKAAEQGHVEAQMELASLFQYGRGVPISRRIALQWYHKAADQGHSKALHRIGLTQPNGEKAFHWHRKAACQGNLRALYEFFRLYRKFGNHLNLKRTVSWFHPSGDFVVGFHHGFGIGKFEKNYVEASFWYHQGAEKGHSKAQFHFARLLECEHKYNEAFQWYMKSAEQGYAKAECFVGYYYETGRATEQDIEKAIYWYHKGIHHGDTQAVYSLANCYDYGKGVERDISKAISLYTQAAEKGLALAQSTLGFGYLIGTVVPKDIPTGLRWFTMAANQDGLSSANLGHIYEQGNLVPRDLIQAALWYENGAKMGHPWAKYRIGYCYYHGNGVTQDFQKAARWLEEPSESGLGPAISLLT